MTYESSGAWDIDVPIYRIKQFKFSRGVNRIPLIRTFLRWRYRIGIADRVAEIIKQHGINLIFSFANPQESNLIGAMIKERTGVPLVSHFSDPWYDNPANSFSRRHANRVLKQEMYIIKNSGSVVFINDDLRAMVMKKYPAQWLEKGVVIHHSYSPSDYPLGAETIVKQKSKNKFVFCYVGVFNKERNPEMIFQALKDVVESDRTLKNKVEFQLVGCDGDYAGFSIDKVKELIEKYQLQTVVTLVPRMSFRESLRYMQLADCLIIIDVRYQQNYCLPSKLIDYAGSGSPVIGISNHDSPIAVFLKKLGYKNFTFDELEQLTAYMKYTVTHKPAIQINKDYLDQFHISSNTRKLLALFSRVLSMKV